MFQADKEIEKFLSRYGRTMKLVKGEEETPFKGFLQPLRYKNKMYLSSVSTDLCYDSTGKYLLICPAEFDVGDADGYEAAISDGEKRFSADRCEMIYFGESAAYCWAIVTAL